VSDSAAVSAGRLCRIAAATVLVAVLAGVGLSKADEPLPPPARIETKSPRGYVTVVSTPGAATRILDSASRRLLWNIPGWHRLVVASDDGLHAVIGPEGLNLLPLDYRDSDPLLRFWRSGKLVRTVTVGEFVPRELLRRTVTHYHWGSIKGLDNENRMVVERIDGRLYRFDLATGSIVSESSAERLP